MVCKIGRMKALLMSLSLSMALGSCSNSDTVWVACYVIDWAAIGGFADPDEVPDEGCGPYSVQECLDEKWGDLDDCCNNVVIVSDLDPWTPENDPLCQDVLAGVPTTGDMPEDSTGDNTPTGGTTGGDEQDTEGGGSGTGQLPTTTTGSSSTGDSSSTGIPEEQDPFLIAYDPNGEAQNFLIGPEVTLTRASLKGADPQHPFTDLTVFVRNKECELFDEGEDNTPVGAIVLVYLDPQGKLMVDEPVPLVGGEAKLPVELYLDSGQVMNTLNVRAAGTKDGTACVGYRSGNPNVSYTGPILTHTFGAGSAL